MQQSAASRVLVIFINPKFFAVWSGNDSSAPGQNKTDAAVQFFCISGSSSDMVNSGLTASVLHGPENLQWPGARNQRGVATRERKK
jgi:hypothetical protein